MRILLVGEYSRLHNSLKEGLLKIGHEVKIVGTGDDFKNFPVDFSIDSLWFNNYLLLKFCKKAAFRIFKIDLRKVERAIRFYLFLPKLKKFDVVQLINSDAIETFSEWEIYLYKKLFKQNDKVFLLICGEETPVIDVLLNNNLKYSILTPLFKNPNLKEKYFHTLNYTFKKKRKVYDFIKSKAAKIMVSDLDYKIPMEQTETKCFFIPNPVNVDKIQVIDNPINNKIIIFHGKNKYGFVKKGSVYFEVALEELKLKYGNKIEIVLVNSLPYVEYEKLLNRAHIVLDQVYSFDQGYNALEAMAKGKVVFTGAEIEFYEHYNLTTKVALNALDNVNYLVEELSNLIDNPKQIIEIGQNARTFIENEHNYIAIAKKYIEIWN
jgi:glycosyltransferase involved in cell wall biosynthesis